MEVLSDGSFVSCFGGIELVWKSMSGRVKYVHILKDVDPTDMVVVQLDGRPCLALSYR